MPVTICLLSIDDIIECRYTIRTVICMFYMHVWYIVEMLSLSNRAWIDTYVHVVDYNMVGCVKRVQNSP